MGPGQSPRQRRQGILSRDDARPGATPTSRAHGAVALVSALATLLAGCAAYLPKPATPVPEVASEPGPSGWETPPLFSATRILPAPLLTGVHHALEDLVVNDGASHLFVISSEFGSFEAAGLAKLRIRLNEIRGIAAIRRRGPPQCTRRRPGKRPSRGSPGSNTTSRSRWTRSGNRRRHQWNTSASRSRRSGEWTSSRDDDMPEALIGFADQKRVIAYDLHVDPVLDQPGAAGGAEQPRLGRLRGTGGARAGATGASGSDRAGSAPLDLAAGRAGPQRLRPVTCGRRIGCSSRPSARTPGTSTSSFSTPTTR